MSIAGLDPKHGEETLDVFPQGVDWNMASSRRVLHIVLAFSASLLLLGCGTNNSYVRTVNASPGLTHYTVQVGVTGIASSLPYGTEGVQPQGEYAVTDSSGNYRAIGAGKAQKVLVYQTSSSPLATISSDFLKNSYYTVVTLGAAPAVALLTLQDGDTAPSSGNFKLRMIQAAPTTPAVDIYITAQGAGIGGATPILSDFQFGQVTQQYLPLSPGPLEIQVTPHGNPSKIIYSGAFTANAGDIYSGFFLDPPAPGSTTYGFLLVKDPVLTATKTSTH